MLHPIEGPAGVRYVSYSPPGLEPGGDVFISKDCKIPEIAYKWADYLMSEEVYFRLYFGEENKDWAAPKQGEVGMDNKPARIKELSLMYNLTNQNRAWMWMSPIINDGVNDGSVIDITDTTSWNLRLYKECVEKYELYKPDGKYILPNVVFTPDEIKDFTKLKNDIMSQVADFRDGTAQCYFTADAQWDNYLSKLNEVGIKEYLEMVQKAYNRQYK